MLSPMANHSMPWRRARTCAAAHFLAPGTDAKLNAMRLAVTLLFAAAAFAADQDFNGRWDITTTGQPRPRAMWLELTGMGSPNPTGKFVSAYNGDMNKVDSIAVENGELRFGFNLPARG